MAGRLSSDYRRARLARLADAVREGRLEDVARLLDDRRIDPVAALENGETIFYCAAMAGRIDVLEMLLAHPRFDPAAHLQSGLQFWFERDRPDVGKVLLDSARIAPGASDAQGNTLLHLAAGKGAGGPAWVGLLVERCDVNARNGAGRTALHFAANDAQCTWLLLQGGAEPDAADEAGARPLHFAVAAANLEVIRMLREAGADMDAPDHFGMTPLIVAADAEQPAALEALLAMPGVKVDAKTRAGDTALTLAARRNSAKMVSLLLDSGADAGVRAAHGAGLLHLAAQSGAGMVNVLLKRGGFDVDTPDSNGRTPLHYAMFARRDDTVAALLEAGAAADRKDIDHCTPMMTAAGARLPEVVKMLLAAGGNPNTVSRAGQTALTLAIRNGDAATARHLLDQVDMLPPVQAAFPDSEEIALLLLERNAPWEFVDRYGQSALHRAVHYGFDRLVEALVKKGAEVNVRDKEIGITPLIMTISHGRDACFRQLLKVADPDFPDHEGSTPLIYAVLHGSYEAAEALLQAGADPKPFAGENAPPLLAGKTALQLAESLNQEEIRRLLEDALALQGGDVGILPQVVGKQSLPLPPLDPALYLVPNDGVRATMFARSGRSEKKSRQELPDTDIDTDDETQLIVRQEARYLESPVEARRFLKSFNEHTGSMLGESRKSMNAKIRKFSVPLVAPGSTRVFQRGMAVDAARLEAIAAVIARGVPEEMASLAYALMHVGQTNADDSLHGITGISTLPAIAEHFLRVSCKKFPEREGVILRIEADGGEKAARGVTARKVGVWMEAEVILDPSNEYTFGKMEWDKENKRCVIEMKASNPAPPQSFARKAPLPATTILGRSISQFHGTTRSAIFEGKDRIRRYVKFFTNPDRAYEAALADKILRDLGLHAPQSQAFLYRQGAPAYASRMMEGLRPFNPDDAEAARAFFEGFAADVLLMNGKVTGDDCGDLFLTEEGKPLRLNNGHSFQHSEPAFKDADEPEQLQDIEGFFDPQVNPVYASLARRAGYAGIEDIPHMQDQVRRILELGNCHQGWGHYVDRLFPTWEGSRRDEVIQTLNARTRGLQERYGLLDFHAMKDEHGQPRMLDSPPLPDSGS